MELIHEMCPYCEETVELVNPHKKGKQECPSCGRYILPCALCEEQEMTCWDCEEE